MRKGIVIVTEGGKGIGFGHLSRCFSLYYALRSRGEIPMFVTNDDSTGRRYLDDLGVEGVAVRERVDSLGRFRALEGEVCVVDSYRLPSSVYGELAARFELLVSIDDENRLAYPPGVVVNGALYADTIPYRQSPDVIYLLGPAYFMVKPVFAGIPARKARETVREVLITVGGVDWGGLTKRLIEIAGRLKGVVLHVLTTDGFEDLQGVYRAAEKVPADIQFYYNHPNPSGIMARCDLAFSAGGQTTYELAACGVPTIGICIAHNQLQNLKAWEAAGFLLFAGWWDAPDLDDRLRECLETVLPQSVRERMGRQGRSRIDGKGADRVAEVILAHREGLETLKRVGNI